MGKEFASGQPSESVVGSVPAGNDAEPSSKTGSSLPSDGSLSTTPNGAPPDTASLILESRHRREVAWLSYVEDSRKDYRLVLIFSLAFIGIGSFILILASFLLKEDITSLKAISGFFFDVLGAGGIGIYWNKVQQDKQKKWESLSRSQEDEILIERVTGIIMQIDDKKLKSRLLAELAEALIGKI